MSAILNTLRKLEEEKNSLDPVISLENLDIHAGNESPEFFREKPLPWRGGILLFLAGIILGGLIRGFL